ncbi:DUF2690 domain-containing protein [Streptomyces sp. NPDC058326]|uniref:helix-turn-helix domain-containing protein n=1 Tax=Streptomyces sp. NPDC058326 TaxID=3346447 RepID=UPI0036E0C707
MPGWKALPDELDPEVRAFTERLRRLIDRSGLGVTAVAERTGHERSAWDTYLNARLPAPRGAVAALADVTGTDPSELAAHAERADRAWHRSNAIAVAGDGDGDGGGDGHADGEGCGDGDGDRGDRTLRIRRLDGPFPAPASPPDTAAPTPRTPAADGDTAAPAPRTPATAGDTDVPPPRTPATDADGAAPHPPTPSAAPRRRAVLLYAAGIVGALLVVTAALLLVDLGGSEGDGERVAAPPTTTAPPVTRPATLPAGVMCAGGDCAGQDPEAMGCGGPLAATVARARVGTAQVEVRYSETCAAAWARITGAAPGDTVTVEAGGTERRATVAPGADTATTETYAYTPMVAVGSGADARACGTLADGREGCTRDR